MEYLRINEQGKEKERENMIKIYNKDLYGFFSQIVNIFSFDILFLISIQYLVDMNYFKQVV